MTLFEEMGGEPVLRGVIDTFVRRLVTDPLIGFFFKRTNVARLRQLEYEHAAAHLGGGVEYTGRALPEAHAPHRIMGGQFQRRVWLLEEVLVQCEIPTRVREHWLAHTRSLEPLITGKPASTSCNDAAS